MRRLLYWGLATVLLAAVVHLFVVIFVPGVDSGQKMAQLEAAGEINVLHRVAVSGEKATLLTEASPDIAYAFCKFDISSKPLLVEGSIPPSYWSVSFYSNTGENIYTLNDRQAGTDKIRLLVVRSTRQFDDASRPENTIIVHTPTTSGLVLFRAFVADRSMTPSIDKYLDTSRCSAWPGKISQG